MKSVFRFGAAAAVIAATLVGCDWGGVSSSESWNDAYAWANFSGTYKLVTAVVPSVDTSEGENAGLDKVKHEENFNISLGSNKHNYQIANFGKGIVPGSVTVVIFKNNGKQAYEYTDDGNGTLIYAANPQLTGVSGTIKYDNGRITLNWDIQSIVSGTVAYSYYAVPGAVSTPSGSEASNPITWLNVTQKGNLLTLQDNDGRVYSGKITGASCPDADAAGYVTAGHIRFSFEATCTSNAKYKISGSLSGNWSGAQNETSGTISDRTIDGSFVNGGSPTQFQAVSGPVTVLAKTVTPTAGAY